MAQPQLDSFIRRGFLLKLEGTEGQDSVPVVGTDGILLLNGSSGTTFEKRTRQTDRAVMGNYAFAVANKGAFIEGDFELFSPATPGQVATGNYVQEILLLSAGMDVVKAAGPKTTKYSPKSTAIASASGYWWHIDSHLHVLGCRNDLKSVKMEIGQIFGGKAHVQGNYTSVVKDSLPSGITLYTTVPVTCAYNVCDADIKVGGGAALVVWAKSLELTLGSDLKSKEYSAVKKNAIASRAPTWKMRIAKTDLADFSPVNIRDAGTKVELRMRTWEGGNNTSGNWGELYCQGQIETVDEVEIDGDFGWDLSGPCIPTNAATEAIGDEFYIMFGTTP